MAATIGPSAMALRTRFAQNKASIPQTIAVLTMTMLFVIRASELSTNEWPASANALRQACAPRLRISRATLTAIARRASVSCHLGIRKASNSRLTVEANVENEDRKSVV